jgi:hypothetical protein
MLTISYPNPVGRRSQSHRLCTITTGVKLTDDGPYDGCPGHSVSSNKQTRECDHCGSCFRSVLRNILIQSEVSDRGKHQETDEHPNTSSDQSASSAELLDNVGARNGHSEIDASKDHRSLKRVIQTSSSEDSRAVVEEEVGSSELL